ncbi:MAG: DUF2852 domain-containing protein [Gammaproteobacteria bacterium]|nr:DUF2852 domain-containing protein [Gammaproteobacteria bacterium]
MSSTDYSHPGHVRGRCVEGAMRSCCGGHWSGANIAAMVLGFVLFPPLGLAVLIWTMMGRPIQDLPGWVREKWTRMFGKGGTRSSDENENVVFNEYQQTQYDRISEIKEEIKRRAEAFRTFRFDAKRRADRREFDDFMSSNPDRGNDRN